MSIKERIVTLQNKLSHYQGELKAITDLANELDFASSEDKETLEKYDINYGKIVDIQDGFKMITKAIAGLDSGYTDEKEAEMKFSSTNEALQYLASFTGKRVKISSFNLENVLASLQDILKALDVEYKDKKEWTTLVKAAGIARESGRRFEDHLYDLINQEVQSGNKENQNVKRT